MAENNLRFTVFTPVYNRKHTIHRGFESLMRQTVKNFEWLIIDDGSTDNLKPLIDEFIEKADFPIRYVYKENGGKHTATNMAYKLMETEYFTILDSDDALTDNAVEKMLSMWDKIPVSEKSKYWSVVGHCINSESREIIGEYFLDGINDFDDEGKRASVKGDKTAALRTDIMKRYPFPEPEGTTFVTESVVYNKVEKDYKQYYFNDILKIVYYEDDSLTNAWYRDHVKEGYVSNFVWKQSIINDVKMNSLKDYYILFQYTFYGVMSNKKLKEITSGLDKGLYKAICTLLYLPAKAVKLLRKLRGADV